MLFYGLYLFTVYRKPAKNFAIGARVWGSGIAKIINLTVNVHGDINQVSGLVVSNHLSYIDILAFASILPLRFAPKSDLATWPVIGWFLTMSRPIWVNRSSRQASVRTMNEFLETLKLGMSVVVFPEGTSTDGKHGVLPFKSTPFESAVVGGFMVNPVLIQYEEKEGGIVSWYGDMTFLPHAWSILGRRRICAHVYILPKVSPDGLNRKDLAKKTYELLKEEYTRINSN